MVRIVEKIRAGLLLAVVGCFLSLAGCDSNLPTYEVAGTVEFSDGTKPKFGDIEFYSPDHKINARGKINRDGTFTVSTFEDGDGAVVGHHQIVIMQQVGSYLLAKSESKIKHDHGSLIDRRYFDYRTSDLICEIKAGQNKVFLVVEKLPRQTPEGLAH
jgi:hypothetical protein